MLLDRRGDLVRSPHLLELGRDQTGSHCVRGLREHEPRGVRDVTYDVSSPARGTFRIGPLSVRLADPFGLCELTRSFSSHDELVVHPVVVPLTAVALGGDWAGGGLTGAVRVTDGVGDEGGAEEGAAEGDWVVGVGTGSADSVAATVEFGLGPVTMADSPVPYW